MLSPPSYFPTLQLFLSCRDAANLQPLPFIPVLYTHTCSFPPKWLNMGYNLEFKHSRSCFSRRHSLNSPGELYPEYSLLLRQAPGGSLCPAQPQNIRTSPHPRTQPLPQHPGLLSAPNWKRHLQNDCRADSCQTLNYEEG